MKNLLIMIFIVAIASLSSCSEENSGANDSNIITPPRTDTLGDNENDTDSTPAIAPDCLKELLETNALDVNTTNEFFEVMSLIASSCKELKEREELNKFLKQNISESSNFFEDTIRVFEIN